jgi:hypothetical protein
MAHANGFRSTVEIVGGGKTVTSNAFKDDQGQVWWPLRNGQKCVSDYATVLNFRKRPMSKTNVLDVLKKARQVVLDKLRCGAGPASEAQEAATRFMADIFVASTTSDLDTPPKKRRSRKPLRLDMELPEEVSVQVPEVPGGCTATTLTVKLFDKPSWITCLVNETFLRWLQEYVRADIATLGFKRSRNGGGCINAVQSHLRGVSYDHTRGAWRASFRSIDDSVGGAIRKNKRSVCGIDGQVRRAHRLF